MARLPKSGMMVFGAIVKKPLLETFLTFGKIGGGVGETVEFYRGELEIIAVPQILRSSLRPCSPAMRNVASLSEAYRSS